MTDRLHSLSEHYLIGSNTHREYLISWESHEKWSFESFVILSPCRSRFDSRNQTQHLWEIKINFAPGKFPSKLPKAARVPATVGWLLLLKAKSWEILGNNFVHKMNFLTTSPASLMKNDSSVPVFLIWSRISFSTSNFSTTVKVSRGAISKAEKRLSGIF